MPSAWRSRTRSAARTRTSSRCDSHQKAIAAIDEGRFEAEIVPVTVRDAKGRETVVTVDEGPRRDTTIEALARLKPVFALPDGEDRGDATDGTVTAGNAPGITDGAAATVVASERTVERYGLKPLARIVGYAQAEVEPKWLFLAPVKGVRRLLDRIEMPIEAFDLIEINEAFAAQIAGRWPRARLRLGQGQRQRRRDRAGSPDRRVGSPDRRDPPPRARSGARAATGWQPLSWRRRFGGDGLRARLRHASGRDPMGQWPGSNGT